jgi:uncharacterized protein (DUF302 family)
VKKTLKKKLNVYFQKYLILGAFNPYNAYKALQTENEIGTTLPCNESSLLLIDIAKALC